MGFDIPGAAATSAATSSATTADLAKEDKRVNAANRPLYAGGGVIGTFVAGITEAARNKTRASHLADVQAAAQAAGTWAPPKP